MYTYGYIYIYLYIYFVFLQIRLGVFFCHVFCVCAQLFILTLGKSARSGQMDSDPDYKLTIYTFILIALHIEFALNM